MSRINKLIDKSKQVILDCALDNGGIVAANSTRSYYPTVAKNYFYIWPRDAAFTCIAADMAEIPGVANKFFGWCLNNAEGFNTKGLFYEKYYPNGLKALQRFQPDQTGAVLYAVWHCIKHNSLNKNELLFKEITEKAANGICSVWRKGNFIENTNDLWEERLCFPDLSENFTYSLASCIGGLICANELFPDSKWSDVAKEMKERLDKHFIDFFVRSYGAIPDKRIDASILGLVFPFEIYDPDDIRIINSVKEIEKKLSVNGGIHRYENDDYDGWMTEGEHRKKGAGAWPILNFWLSIYFKRKGDREKAEYYYNWVLDRIPETYYIPEQIFENNIQVSVSPLLWSHVMFIIASKELGYF